MHVLAVGVLEITIISERDDDIQIFLNGDVLLNEKWKTVNAQPFTNTKGRHGTSTNIANQLIRAQVSFSEYPSISGQKFPEWRFFLVTLFFVKKYQFYCNL